jgi:hypothetical protein
MLVLSGKTEPLGKFRCTLADTMTGDIKKIRWNGKLDSSGSRDGRRGPELANMMTNLRFPLKAFSVVSLFASPNTQSQLHISASVSRHLLTPCQGQHRISNYCPPVQNPVHTSRSLGSPQLTDRFYNPRFLKRHTGWKLDTLRFRNFVCLQSHKILNKLNITKHNKFIEIYMDGYGWSVAKPQFRSGVQAPCSPGNF